MSVTAVILGGGRGSRLYPLTKDRAKPGVPFAGKFRLIDIPMSNCIHSGLERIFILTQFNSASLNHHVSETYQFGTVASRSVRILAAEQTPTSEDWYQGTADAVRQTLTHLVDSRYRPEHILILSGDHLYRMDYRRMIRAHIATEADVTVSTIPVPREEASRFGILKLGTCGRITHFVEKPESGEAVADLATDLSSVPGESADASTSALLGSMGIYIFKTEVLIDKLKDPANVDFGGDLIPGCIHSDKVYGHVFHGYWADIGTVRSFYEANMGLLDRVPRFDFYNEAAPVYTFRHHLPSAKINESQVRESMLAEGSIVDRSSITRSIIGLRCFVREDAQVNASLLMGSDYYESAAQIKRNADRGIPHMGIGRRCSIANTIVDKNARIGDDVVLENREGVEKADEPHCYIRDHIVIVPKDAVVPSGTVV